MGKNAVLTAAPKGRNEQRLVQIFWVLGLSLLFTACSSDLKPRPRGYPRIELPMHSYQTFADAKCPYTFEYPAYGKLVADAKNNCFYDIAFDKYQCRWHVTLRDFKADKTDYFLGLEDYRQVVFKHSRKGSVLEHDLKTNEGLGRMFTLYGEVPEPASFYFSDSSRYALIVSIYFNTGEKNDSLQPIIRHMATDLEHMVSTLKFKK